MRTLFACTTFAFMVLIAFGVAADAEQSDIENADTPASLLELLPEDDKDWPAPFWLRYADPGKGEAGQSYIGWAIERQGEDIVLRFSHGEKDSHSSTTLVYNAEGSFKSIERREIGSGDTHISTGIVEGDELVFQSVTILTRPGEEPRRFYGEERTTPLKELFRAMPMHWLPLVVAHHARRGHLGYTFSLHVFVHDSEEVFQIKVEDIGAEPVAVGGKPRNARLLRMQARDAEGKRLDGDKLRITGTFLKNGECVGLLFSNGQFTAKASHASRGEIDRVFSLPADDEAAEEEMPAD